VSGRTNSRHYVDHALVLSISKKQFSEKEDTEVTAEKNKSKPQYINLTVEISHKDRHISTLSEVTFLWTFNLFPQEYCFAFILRIFPRTSSFSSTFTLSLFTSLHF
jgi:hypothetical protein